MNDKFSLVYNDLSRWNAHDDEIIRSLDKIFLPIIITGLTTSLAKYINAYPYAFVGSWFLLTFWALMCWRIRTRTKDRFRIMGNIEQHLNIEGHHSLTVIKFPLRDRTIRWVFYWAALVLTSVIGVFHPCTPQLCGKKFVYVAPLLISIILMSCLRYMSNPHLKFLRNK